MGWEGYEGGNNLSNCTGVCQIDRRLGDIELFKEIVDELHERGIRVVLDGVFNHTGREHEAFRAIANEGPGRSKYANWYDSH
eukprot:scaffold181048_cov51-Prasinocladus_malaysianus.AAC.1